MDYSKVSLWPMNLLERGDLIIVVLGATIIISAVLLGIHQHGQYPLINPRGTFEFTQGRVKQHFVRNGRQLLEKGIAKYHGRPFRIMTDHGMMTVVHPKYTEELRNIPELNHARAIAKVS